MTPRTRREFIGTGALAACGRAAVERPNIVIYYVDELRATALRMHNPDGLGTPNLERLAQRGVTFDNAFTPHPLCMPARSSLWTGQYTHTTGSRDNQHPLRDDRVSMTGILHKAGYTLGIFGKNHCFTAPQLERWFAANYSSGSRQWNEALTPEVAGQVKALRKWIADRGGGTMPPEAHPFPAEVCDTHLCTQRAIEFIEKKRQGPFAAWISITDPHHPMQAPESFARGVPSPAQVKLPPYRKGEIRGKNTRMQIYEYLVRGEEIPEDFLRRYLSIYYRHGRPNRPRGGTAHNHARADRAGPEHHSVVHLRPWRLCRRTPLDPQDRKHAGQHGAHPADSLLAGPGSAGPP